MAGVASYLVHGNHDLDFDGQRDDYPYDTFRRALCWVEYAPYVRQVHFIDLDDVKYPCTPQDHQARRCTFCDIPETSPIPRGVISERQMQWLANDMKRVSGSRLLAPNVHSPSMTYIEWVLAPRQVYAGAARIFARSDGQRGLWFACHTHSLVQPCAMENYAARAAVQLGEACTPACGLWWVDAEQLRKVATWRDIHASARSEVPASWAQGRVSARERTGRGHALGQRTRLRPPVQAQAFSTLRYVVRSSFSAASSQRFEQDHGELPGAGGEAGHIPVAASTDRGSWARCSSQHWTWPHSADMPIGAHEVEVTRKGAYGCEYSAVTTCEVIEERSFPYFRTDVFKRTESP